MKNSSSIVTSQPLLTAKELTKINIIESENYADSIKWLTQDEYYEYVSERKKTFGCLKGGQKNELKAVSQIEIFAATAKVNKIIRITEDEEISGFEIHFSNSNSVMEVFENTLYRIYTPGRNNGKKLQKCNIRGDYFKINVPNVGTSMNIERILAICMCIWFDLIPLTLGQLDANLQGCNGHAGTRAERHLTDYIDLREIELVSKEQNNMHRRVCKRLFELTGNNYVVSASWSTFMNFVLNNYDSDVIRTVQQMDLVTMSAAIEE